MALCFRASNTPSKGRVHAQALVRHPWKGSTPFTDQACSWVREQVSRGKPFFCYLALSAPHRPCLPPTFAKGLSAAGPRGDMVCVVDRAVSRIASLLDELQVASNTLFIVTSDHGADLADYDGETYGHRSNGEWRGQKADIFEDGHRVPFLARWPGRIPRGSVTRELISPKPSVEPIG